ncbi:DEAD/DEAH box helicase family protein [Ruminococcus albus]|uniref:Helicase conserved C-terminal domain-containing protein n=1 Tax=Ruminococcus albus TaxID=1264 RepID=A0A1I1FNK5_RUMAL|nr:DEAD/DEAH box helicase family protein [Ruminococcus albus]SFC00576.1 Helicase conserved C-terminal domain-containing protein [Ruminococcus albus]
MFISTEGVKNSSWQSFERVISRLLMAEGFNGARVVGQSNDHGADIVASRNGIRWVFQAKHWNKPVGIDVIDETLRAAQIYNAKIPVIVASNGFDSKAIEHQRTLMSNGIPLQLWDVSVLIDHVKRLPNTVPNTNKPREYQEDAIVGIVNSFMNKKFKALAVMATGLGKTFVAAEAIRRILVNKPNLKVLVLAHTNPLVYQLERSFWKFMTKEQTSIIWNGYEEPTLSQLEKADFVFACVNSVSDYATRNEELPKFDIIIVDECHHAGSSMYQTVFNYTMAGKRNGSFLLGLTATPWRPDEIDLSDIFGETVVCIDMVEGLQKGFLSNVDYRMYTDNIDWDSLKNLNGQSFTPKQINRTLFIEQWDDSVVYELKKTWREQPNPRAIIFCGTIDHANIMCTKLNAMGFCKAAAIYSNSGNGYTMTQFEKNRILTDFSDGNINVVCTVDIFNEGIDVPDVNILVFQRVTHSRRIFIQQLGRGLRISDNKDKVIVLDFVSDIRRFAAGIELKDGLEQGTKQTTRISIPNTVTFRKVTGDDPETERFLRIWLDDIVAIEESGDNSSILKFPPILPNSKR